MFSVEDLLTIKKKPKVNDEISLKLLAEFYEKELTERIFYFDLEDGTKINLVFKIEYFCHLIAIHYFTPSGELKSLYQGHNGFERVMNEEITFDTLKTTNKRQFKAYRERMQCFAFVYQLLRECSSIYFDRCKVTGDCKIEIEIALHKEYDGKMMHLGICLENSNDQYFPKTFFISKGKSMDKYTKEQVKVNIIDRKIVI